jgi:hypothetical protein
VRVGVLSAVRIHHVKNTSLDTEGRQEPRGRVKREGSRELQEGYVKTAGKKRRQPKKGQLLSEDGRNGGAGARQRRGANEITSKPKSVGRKQQSRRKGKGKSNQQTE